LNINLLATSLSNKVDFLLIELADINIISTAKKFDASRGFIGGDDYLVYDLLKKNQMEAVIVDYWKRIPKESFQNWYKSQSRYRTKEDREKDALLEDATITMPEMAQQLRTTRSMINKWADKGKFTVIKVGSRVRIRRDEFEDWMEQKERSMQ